MVKFQATALDRTFGALADPTRRALLAALSEHDTVTVSELARPFAVSLPAIMKHLDVLSDAGLVARHKTGRVVKCHLKTEPMERAMEWLNRYEQFWNERLDNLAAFLEEESCQPSPPSSQASPSGAGSTRRRPRSSPPGPIRKK